MSFTNDGELKGSSIEGSDVRRTPRLVVGAALIREVGIRSDGEENSSNKSDVLLETPRLVLRSFGWFLVLEETRFDDQMATLVTRWRYRASLSWSSKQGLV